MCFVVVLTVTGAQMHGLFAAVEVSVDEGWYWETTCRKGMPGGELQEIGYGKTEKIFRWVQ